MVSSMRTVPMPSTIGFSRREHPADQRLGAPVQERRLGFRLNLQREAAPQRHRGRGKHRKGDALPLPARQSIANEITPTRIAAMPSHIMNAPAPQAPVRRGAPPATIQLHGPRAVSCFEHRAIVTPWLTSLGWLLVVGTVDRRGTAGALGVVDGVPAVRAGRRPGDLGDAGERSLARRSLRAA